MRSLDPYLELGLAWRELVVTFLDALGLPRLLGWVARWLPPRKNARPRP